LLGMCCSFKFSNANDLFENMFKTEEWQDDDSGSPCPEPLRSDQSTIRFGGIEGPCGGQYYTVPYSTARYPPAAVQPCAIACRVRPRLHGSM
jgi:hypothetical protein